MIKEIRTGEIGVAVGYVAGAVYGEVAFADCQCVDGVKVPDVELVGQLVGDVVCDGVDLVGYRGGGCAPGTGYGRGDCVPSVGYDRGSRVTNLAEGATEIVADIVRGWGGPQLDGEPARCELVYNVFS